MDLKSEIELAKAREQAQTWDRNEATLTAQLAPQLPPPPELDNEIRRHLAPFITWATAVGVRYCPAKPTVVAAYVFAASAISTSEDIVLAQVEAISILHDHYQLPDPTCTTAARFALDHATVKTEPPRSWKKEEKVVFLRLPADIRAVVSRRDREAEVALRRKQNELAEAIRTVELRQSDGAAEYKEPSLKLRTTEKETANG